MLTEELRNKLIEMMKKDPKAAIKELEKDPKLMEIILANDNELKRTKEQLNNERVKYVNMNSHMQTQLTAQANRLRTTQGLLIGAGILMLLALLDKE